jgi:membrane protease YdiL (CAAX protease family)
VVVRENRGLLAPKIKFSHIFGLFIFAFIVDLIAVLLAKSLNASPFLVTVVDVGVDGAAWIIGYQAIAGSCGWEKLRVRFSAVGGKILLVSAAGAVALILLEAGATEILELLGVKMAVIPPEAIFTSELSQLPLLLGVTVIVAPVAEEIMFRGLLLDWLKQKMAPWPAVLIISLLFACLHNNHLRSGAAGWLELTTRFLMGVGTSFLALHYKSLRPPFVMHATNNCIVTVSGVFPSLFTGN